MTRKRVSAPILALMLLAIAALVALGVWQIQRRSWKLALIAQTEARLAASPVAAPGPARWPSIDKRDAYTRVMATGHFRAGADSYVQAVTDYGSGYWVVTPLDTGAFTVLVNRGFVPADQRGRAASAPGERRVTGLLRVTEPGGAFLRHNAPKLDRWYSRDVAAIAARHGLGRVAPYFIDADASGAGWPRGGLTVIRFPNNHLVYAITWFAMAALLAFMTYRVAWRDERR